MLDRWGNPVNHGEVTPVIPPWWMAAGITPWAAYKAKGAASLAASYIDLTGQGRNVAPGVAPALVATGWDFDGLTNYLITTFIPQNDQSQSAFVQYTAGLNAARVFGMRTAASATRQFFVASNGGGIVSYGNGGAVNQAPNLVAGNLGIAGNRGYRNGVAEGGAAAAWSGVAADAVWIGCYNNGGAAALFFDGIIQAFVIYDVTLTAPQSLLIATAMAAL